MNTKLTTAVEAYFADLRRVHVSGGATGERSRYGPLCSLPAMTDREWGIEKVSEKRQDIPQLAGVTLKSISHLSLVLSPARYSPIVSVRSFT